MPVQERKSTKPAASSTRIPERRRSMRRNVKVLAGFRCRDKEAPIQDGFARAISLSTVGALLELPDLYKVGQEFELEFLLDNNFIAPVKGNIVRITKRKEFYEVAIDFTKVPAKAKRLIEQQTDDD